MPSSKSYHAWKWLAALAVFSLVAGLADWFWTQRIIYPSQTSEAGKVWQCLYGQEDFIPIFGASSTRAAFIPELMPVDAFNYGMNGSSYDVMDVLIQAELQKNKTTPIILGMNYEFFHGVGDISKFIPFAWRPEVRQALADDQVMSWRFRLPGIRYFGYYDWYLKDYLSERTGLTRRVVKGYEHKLNALGFDAGRFAEAVRKRHEAGFGFTADPKDTERLRERINSAPQRKFVLVYLPLHESCLENFQGMDEFNAAIARWRTLSNVVVLDYSHLRYPDDYFEDTVHLNERGATEFTRQFAADFSRILKSDQPPENHPAVK